MSTAKTRVIGLKAPDDKWKKMEAVYRACEAAGVDTPIEVKKFFDFEPPKSGDVEVNLTKNPCMKNFDAEMKEGFDINLEALRKFNPTIHTLRVYTDFDA